MTSSPWKPKIRSSPPSPWITSGPLVPLMMSGPFVPVMLMDIPLHIVTGGVGGGAFGLLIASKI